MTEPREIVLGGCRPVPLSSYLKGLGLLRLLTRRDPTLRAAWRGEHLVLTTGTSLEELRGHLLAEYAPTPIVAPWNAGGGFYYRERKSKEKDPATGKQIKLGIRDQATTATKTVDTVLESSAERLGPYRAVLRLCRELLAKLKLKEAPQGTEKDRLLLMLRSLLSDEALEWIDAAVLITAEESKFPPLLGTGGNDGNLDISSNFMQRLLDLIDPRTGEPTTDSAAWLDLALRGAPAPGLVKNAIGQFAPSQVGGPNATTGYEANGGMNPWDFVLMVEGALAFAAAAVRRGARDGDGVLSYPFTVRATAAGAGNLGAGDCASARGEIWMPLWSHPASDREVRALLAEGRVALGTRPARDALDFVRAVHRLGGYRGVDRFQRYGLLMRSGRNYLATPLERVQVTKAPQSDWIDELETGEWLSRLRRFSQGDAAANRFVILHKRLEDLLFDLARRTPAPSQVQALLGLLGEIQYALAASGKARDAVAPVPRLSARWPLAADDGTPAYRIARAFAGLRGEEGTPLPLRAQIFPVHPRTNAWIRAACSDKGAGADPACRVRLHVPVQGDLVGTLIALLERRLWIADRLELSDKPLLGPAGIGLDDLDAFLRDDRMDARIAALVPGLALCEIPYSQDQGAGEGPAPAAYGLLRLALTPDAWLRTLTGLPREQRVPVPPGLVPMLASGSPEQARRAVALAWRRLRSSGLTLAMSANALPELLGLDPRRLAAALSIPLTYGATAALVRSVLKRPESDEDAA